MAYELLSHEVKKVIGGAVVEADDEDDANDLTDDD